MSSRVIVLMEPGPLERDALGRDALGGTRWGNGALGAEAGLRFPPRGAGLGPDPSLLLWGRGPPLAVGWLRGRQGSPGCWRRAVERP